MSCYISCPYDCAHKEIARSIFKDLNNAGVPTFFTGDIPEDRKFDVLKETISALEQSAVFIPILCDAFVQNRHSRQELMVAFCRETTIVPVLVESGVSFAGLITGVRISDVTSSAKYEVELPLLIETIRPLIPSKLVQNLRFLMTWLLAEQQDRQQAAKTSRHTLSVGQTALQVNTTQLP